MRKVNDNYLIISLVVTNNNGTTKLGLHSGTQIIKSKYSISNLQCETSE